MAAALINGKSYGWNNVVIRLSNGSLPLVGVKSISYTKSREKENLYGAGSDVTARGYGNYTYEASITITMEELVKIQKSAPSGDILELPMFEIIVTYIHPERGKIVNDIIQNAEFVSVPKNLNQNDKEFPVELELIISGIKEGVSAI